MYTYTEIHIYIYTYTHIYISLSLSVAQKCQTPWTCCEHLPSACTPALCSKHSLYEHSLKNTKAPTEHEAQQPEARCTRTYRFPWCQNYARYSHVLLFLSTFRQCIQQGLHLTFIARSWCDSRLS